ncbi:MAG TPA: hypothetical protein VMD08_02050 [Candidatus Baltobacteraceae bacterium]|nr:hypothetical protein [Candidatus Baltobacteraceae bacterium]
MNNPFVFGETLTDEAFIDRDTEARELERDLADAQKVFLLSPRRFGKSALIAHVLRRLAKRGFRVVTLSVDGFTNFTAFLEGFAGAVTRAAGPYEQAKRWIARFLETYQPEIRVGPTGAMGFGLARGAQQEVRHPQEIFRLPESLTQHGGFRMVVALDEFQQVNDFDGGAVQRLIRDAAQRQRQVGYVFAGSQPTMMEAMLAPKSPFFKAGPTLFLDRIPKAVWQEYVPAQFARRKRTITPAAIDLLLSTADLIPYDVQRLAHEVWDHAELTRLSRLDVTHIAAVTNQLVASMGQVYERLWEQVTLRQRAVLRAVANEPERIGREDVRRTYALGPLSSVQRALEGLQNQELISRYRQQYFFLDPLFRAWVKSRR